MTWTIAFYIALSAFIMNFLFGNGRTATGGGLTIGIILGIILYFFLKMPFWEVIKRCITVMVLLGVVLDLLQNKNKSY